MTTLTTAHRLLARLDELGLRVATEDDDIEAAGRVIRSEQHDCAMEVTGDLDAPMTPRSRSPVRLRFVYRADGSVILHDGRRAQLGIHRDWVESVRHYVDPAEYGFRCADPAFLLLSELGRTDEADLYPGEAVVLPRAEQ